jgi:hypothetical protein
MPTLGSILSTTNVATDGLPTSGGTMTGDLTLVGNPTSANHAATKQYVDSVATGSITDWKEAVACATTGNITLSGEQTIDGIATAASRVLVKNQTTGAQNGIYVSAAGAWARSADADVTGEITQGTAVLVAGGSTQIGTTWFVTTTGTITIGTTPITWVQITAGGSASYNYSIRTVSGATTITSGDQVLITTGTADHTISLPAIASAPQHLFVVKASGGSNQVTIDTADTALIMGFATFVLDEPWDSVHLIKSGADWVAL